MKAYAKKNHLGFWVGCLEYEDGTNGVISNAKYTEAEALGVAQRVVESCKEMEVLKTKTRHIPTPTGTILNQS